jgi:hypothetical protein
MDQHALDLAAGAHVQPHADAAFQDRAQLRRHHFRQEIGMAHDLDRSGQMRRSRPRLGQRRFGLVQPVANVRGEFIGGAGGHHAAPVPLEQGAADGLFQAGDLLRNGRLGQPQVARGRGERSLAIDFDKGAQAVERHGTIHKSFYDCWPQRLLAARRPCA